MLVIKPFSSYHLRDAHFQDGLSHFSAIREAVLSTSGGLMISRDSALEMILAMGDYQREGEAIWIYEQGTPEHFKTSVLAYSSTAVNEGELLGIEEEGGSEEKEYFFSESMICAYYPTARILELLGDIKRGEPKLAYSNGNERHRFWRLSGEREIGDVQQAFSKLNKTFLLAGSETLKNGRKKGKTGILSQYIPYYDFEVRSPTILLPALSREKMSELLMFIRQYYHISAMLRGEEYRPRKQGEIGLFYRGKWHKLRTRQAGHLPDQLIFNERVLQHFFSPEQFSYHPTGGEIVYRERLTSTPGLIGVQMFPPDRDQVLLRAGSDRRFPAGSIEIGPALPHGIFMETEDSDVAEREKV